MGALELEAKEILDKWTAVTKFAIDVRKHVKDKMLESGLHQEFVVMLKFDFATKECYKGGDARGFGEVVIGRDPDVAMACEFYLQLYYRAILKATSTLRPDNDPLEVPTDAIQDWRKKLTAFCQQIDASVVRKVRQS